VVARAKWREAIILTGSTSTPEPEPERATEDAVQFEPLAARVPVPEDNPTFAELGARAEIVDALAAVGITRAFAIQEQAIPLALSGYDVIGQARTGTGKTLGFGVPLLQRLDAPENDSPRALVVVPTRELAVQVTHDLAAAGVKLGLRCISIYGGRSYEPQVAALRRGVDVVVGTPGRLLDLQQQGKLKLGRISMLVLDEADEMLDLGFLPDIEKLIALLPSERQTMLFSATMPGPIVALARRFLRQPTQVRAHSSEDHPSKIPPTVQQFAYRAHALDKTEMLARILQARGRGLTMIFCRTKRTAAKVADDLSARGFAAAAVHGDLGQGAREQALRAFRKGKVDVLVATDVAARGLDVDDVTHVINYQSPEDEKVYIHRIGRTARAGKGGTAVTLVDWDETARWKSVCDALELPFHSPAETYSNSLHLFVDLDIPEGTGATLPSAQRVRAGLDAEEVEDLGETGMGRRTDRRRGRTAGRHRSTGRSGEAAPEYETIERAGGEPPRHKRQRRRTRAGRPLDGEAAEGTAVDVDTAPRPEESSGTQASDETARKRRRRRGGRGRRTADAPAESTD
jgi:superfamily II DNA/RNA helicase